MNAKRLISAVILTSMLATLAACGGDSEDTTAVTTIAPVENTEPQEIVPDMPDDLRFDGGNIRILCMENIVVGLNAADEEGEVPVLSQAVYDHNKRVEERFGITFEFTNHGAGYQTSVPNAVRQSANSGSNDYDVVFATANIQTGLINEGMYLPLTELPWVNLEKPWWNQGYIESVSFNSEAPYAMFGNMTYNQIMRSTCVLANITKLEAQHNIIADDLYQIVLDDEWTLDKFTELVNMGYKDDNGNTKKDNGDMFGLAYGDMGIEFLAYSTGLEFTGRDEIGYPTLNLNNERSVDLCEKLIKVLHNNQSAMYFGGSGEWATYFASGQALFSLNRFCEISWWIREMKDDFVILPYPKYDESIDGYHSVVENNVQWGCLSLTVADEDLEMISAAMEQWCYDCYNNVTPLYYENELKLKLTRGEDIDGQSQMIDIITSGARTDYLYVNDISGLKNIFMSCVKAGNNIFASYYAQREVLAAAKLEQLIENYEEMIYG